MAPKGRSAWRRLSGLPRAHARIVVRYLDSTSDAAKARMHGTWFSFMDVLAGLVMVIKSAFQKQNYISAEKTKLILSNL